NNWSMAGTTCSGFILENIGNVELANNGLFIVISRKKVHGCMDAMLGFAQYVQGKVGGSLLLFSLM
ncbi:MAG: hypothetical protein ACXWE9_02970, partial [Methylobacter sp.]